MANIETGKLICKLRKIKNMTQKDLANYLNVSDKAVSKWERGESYPEITIIPQLANILEITVDELLEGKRKIKVPESDNDEEKNFAYECLLEDASNKFLQNTIIVFLVTSIGILVKTLGFNYSFLVAAVVGIGGGMFYFFSLNKYRTSQQRIQRYWEFNKQKEDIYYRIKHSKFFVGIPLGILFVDIFIKLNRFKGGYFNIYKIHDRNLYYSSGCSSIGYILILIAIITSIYIFYNLCNKNMSAKLMRCDNKVLKTTLFSSLISIGLFYGISVFKISTIVIQKYNSLIVNIIALTSVGLVAVLNILLFKKYYKDRANIFWGGIVSSTIQFLVLLYISDSSISYYGSWNDNINLGNIEVYMLVIVTAICSVTINYATNYLLLKYEENIFLKLVKKFRTRA